MDNFNTNVQYFYQRQESLPTPSEFQNIWEGRLDRINMANYRIKQVSQKLCRNKSAALACTEAKEMEVTEID